MKSTDAPSKQAVPFGSNGPREAITATTPPGSNQASYDQGFPPITMTLKSAGGLPPKGQDMNQILFELSSQGRYLSAGGGYPFDAAFATSLAGYPKGALIPNSTASGYWLNTVDDNSANPENTTAALTGWVPVESYGVTNITGLAASGVTLTTLQASKDRITLAGNLTANINIVVPAWVKSWTVVNNCSGSFSVNFKTSSGTGISVPSGSTAKVYGDGVNIHQDLGSAAFRTVGTGANQIPDMSSFSSTLNTPGVMRFPGGFKLMWALGTTDSSGAANVALPSAFDNACFGALAIERNPYAWGAGITSVWAVQYSALTKTAVQALARQVSGGTVSAISGIGCMVLAWGN